MSSGPVRVAVIGTGRIGRMHAEILARRTPGAELGLVYDTDAASARKVAQSLGGQAADSVQAVLESNADAVAICTSSSTHVELIVAAARAGKAIFCEKPISLELDQLDRAAEAVADARIPCHIGFNRRFDPAHASVASAVTAGRIGDPQLLRISSRDPEPPSLAYARGSGGLFLDMTIHDFDMARFVTGSEVVEVFARGGIRIDPRIDEFGDVDTALVTLVHANGCLTAIDNSRRAAYGFDQRVEVFGSDGMAASENPSAHTGVLLTAAGGERPPLPYFFLERYMASYELQWRAFVDALRDGHVMPVTIEDARAPLVIGLAAWQSLREGQPVSLALEAHT